MGYTDEFVLTMLQFRLHDFSSTAYGRRITSEFKGNRQVAAITSNRQDPEPPEGVSSFRCRNGLIIAHCNTSIHQETNHTQRRKILHHPLHLQHHEATNTQHAISLIQGLHSLCCLLRNLHGPIHLHIHHSNRTQHVEATIQGPRRRAGS